MWKDLMYDVADIAEEWLPALLFVLFASGAMYILFSNVIREPAPPLRWRLPHSAEEVCIQGENGEDLWYYTKGQGHTVILLHGAGTSSVQFSFLFKRLATKKIRVVAVDLRGHGHSGLGAGFSARMLADDIQRVMDDLGGTEGFTLVGFGLGGYAALAWRIFCKNEHVKNVKGIVLASGYAMLPTDNSALYIFKVLVSSGWIHFLWRNKRIANSMSRLWFGRVATDSMLEEFRRTTLNCPHKVWARTLKGSQQDLRGFLPHIDTPCLIICGFQDVLYYSAQASLMLLGSKVGVAPKKVTLENFGHSLMWEAPDKLTGILCEHLFPTPVDGQADVPAS